ncbi:MAG TPA: hypothetical protein VHU15_10705 [Stellaceae bacterium]|nr:hypothetical protein [Stellaceae bacterium]
MRIPITAVALIVGSLVGIPAWADSVAVSSGNGGTGVTTGKGRPCHVVTGHNGNSTTVTTGNGGATASTTVSPGGHGSSVTVGSGSSGDTGCVVTQPGK